MTLSTRPVRRRATPRIEADKRPPDFSCRAAEPPRFQTVWDRANLAWDEMRKWRGCGIFDPTGP
eukprot:3226147-Pyramimonas_sp.AAC.1